MRWRYVLILAAAAFGQDGGRDDAGAAERTMLFVRWRRTDESGAVGRAAWAALEPHLVDVVTRKRLYAFDGDPERARAYFAAHPGTALVLALDEASAAAAREALPDVPVVEVSAGPRAAVSLRVPRDRLADLAMRFRPALRRVAAWRCDETLPGFPTTRCDDVEGVRGHDLLWVPEGREIPPGAGVPVVATGEGDPAGASLVVRPDPVGAGLKAAAAVLAVLRDGRDPPRATVSRLKVAVDLSAALEAGHEVPLAMLARADAVRRGP